MAFESKINTQSAKQNSRIVNLPLGMVNFVTNLLLP